MCGIKLKSNPVESNTRTIGVAFGHGCPYILADRIAQSIVMQNYTCVVWSYESNHSESKSRADVEVLLWHAVASLPKQDSIISLV